MNFVPLHTQAAYLEAVAQGDGNDSSHDDLPFHAGPAVGATRGHRFGGASIGTGYTPASNFRGVAWHRTHNTFTQPVVGRETEPRPDGIAEVLGSFRSLYVSRNYTDLTICCPERAYAVHRAVVCPRSPVFTAMLAGGASGFKEARESVICLPQECPQLVHIMIYYLYHLSYDADRQTDISGFDASTAATTLDDGDSPVHSSLVFHPLELHACVYTMADRYDIQGLGNYALALFQTSLGQDWDAKAFMRAVREAYDFTIPDKEDPLRNAVLDALATHGELFEDEEAAKQLKETPSLLYELSKRLLSRSNRLCLHTLGSY